MAFQLNKLWQLQPTKLSKKTRVLIGIFIFLSLTTIVSVFWNLAYLQYEWLNVHLIPHSHDDVGWLQTPENYYSIYVKYILDHVVDELEKNHERKFVYVETYFFWKWWVRQSNSAREIVRNLVKRGQLEIIGGGWCMSDEAVIYYQNFIDQSTWGFRLLNDTFGSNHCPKVAWQIDTFGHSKGIASLLAQMGFDSLFFARIDEDDRAYRKENKLMEFIWNANENLGKSSSIFTSIFYNHYSSPAHFDFESQPKSTAIDYFGFSQYVRKHAQYYRTNNILVPMGDDFRYYNAKNNFEKIDELIEYFKLNTEFKLNVIYSTPSLYLRCLKLDRVYWPEYKEDFFPYMSAPNTYWTGYFTSRPTLKYFERIANNFLQVAKQLLVFTHKGMQFFDELTKLREAVGTVQHHDAITGTAQQHVTCHYLKLLHRGIKKCESPVNSALGNLTVPQRTFHTPTYQSCLLLNISSCEISEMYSSFVVTAYNPLSRRVDHYFRIPVTKRNYVVLTAKGEELKSQIVAIPKAVRNIPGRVSAAKSELVFKANIPALGFKSFYVKERPKTKFIKKHQTVLNKYNLKIIFDSNTQLISEVRSKNNQFPLSQKLKYYKSSSSWSGAYVFRPVSAKTYNPGKKVFTRLLSNGELVKEYEQIFSDWVSQVIRIYKDEDFVEFEWLVGPIPMKDHVGKEVISLYSSNISSGNTFFTDVNGMEMMKRVRDIRSWNKKISEDVSGNYYPVTTTISIQDDLQQMYVVVDRPEGGTSLRSGEIELMVHRRLWFDDGKGVNEALNEIAFGRGLVARGRHWLLFGDKGLEMNQNAKLFAQARYSEPWLFFFEADTLSFEDWKSTYVTELSGLCNYVPSNIRILTLEPWRRDTILLRLEHIFEKLPENHLSNEPVIVSLKELFKNMELLDIRETALGADRWLSEMERLSPLAPEKYSQTRKNNDDLSKMIITLRPQEIRTFIITIKPKPGSNCN